jgi:hypothetical protein
MTTSRAARAVTARQVKQKLVDILFGQEFRKVGPEGHRKLNHSMYYKYDDLKKAYLERLHVLHPDKQRNASSDNDHDNANRKNEFIQLQEIWSQYDAMAKSMMVGGDGESANFTLFGVGCSFSDNEAEKALRSNITDQACRGWFPSGLLPEQDQSYHHEQSQLRSTVSPKITPLIDDSLFIESAESHDSPIQRTPRRTLIPGMK